MIFIIFSELLPDISNTHYVNYTIYRLVRYIILIYQYEMSVWCGYNNLNYISISVPQTIPVSVIPTVDRDNVLFQVIINVSSSIIIIRSYLTK